MKTLDRRASQIVERMAAGVDTSRQQAVARGVDEFGNALPPSGRVPTREELRQRPHHPYNRAHVRQAHAHSEDGRND